MSEPKHTPGPWEATVTGKGIYNRCADVFDSEGDCIAIMDSRGALASPEEINCNAALIAAAPDLLAACELALGYLAADNCNCTQEEYDQVKAAIAKAKGAQ